MRSDFLCSVETTFLVQPQPNSGEVQTYSGLPKCDSQQTVQALANDSDRLVSSPVDFRPCMLKVAHTSGGNVCHQVQQHTSLVCIPNSRPESLESGCIQPYFGESGRICVSSVSILRKVVTKVLDHDCRRMIPIAPDWPNMPWFWDLVNLSVHVPLNLAMLEKLLTQPFNEYPHGDLKNLNLHAWILEIQPS